MSHSVAEILKFIGSYICDEQIGLAQYTFLASERHKKLKDLVRTVETKGVSNNENSLQKLKADLNDLEEYLYLGFCEALDNSFEYVVRFFKSRSSISPRLCIKVIAADYLIALYRKPELFIQDENIRPEDNTAFESVAKGAKYFICNDIPTGIQNGTYKNIRIIKEAALKYRGETNSNTLDEEGYDQEWIKCWKDVTIIVNDVKNKIPSPPETCYKSTMVIPMSLSTKRLDKEFMEQFQILKLSSLSQIAIFGFLCFDHRYINFFDESLDVSFGYILADILSLYLIHQLLYTQYSSAYFRAKNLLDMTKPDLEKNEF